MQIVVTDKDGIQWQSTPTPPVGANEIWMHKEDQDTDIFSTSSGIRTCASGGCPAVFPLLEPRRKVVINRDWQYYAIAINYNMQLINIFHLFDDHLAFCNNGAGFYNADNPRKRDYFFNRLNYAENVRFDKVRTCSRNVMTGTVEGDNLRVFTMDGNLPPPMKPGKSLPRTQAEINLDDYLYNPREHPWMFVVANRVTVKPGRQTSVAPFPRGAQYPWTGDNYNYSFLPLVSCEPVLYPLEHLEKRQTLPSPYRVVTTVGAIMNMARDFAKNIRAR